MDLLYNFLLDLFPLTEEIGEFHVSLGHRIDCLALDALLAPLEARGALLAHLEVLLQLSGDLGYIEREVLSFLLRELERHKTC